MIQEYLKVFATAGSTYKASMLRDMEPHTSPTLRQLYYPQHSSDAKIARCTVDSQAGAVPGRLIVNRPPLRLSHQKMLCIIGFTI